MNSKRVYLLGAGSSIGHSGGVFPSIYGFFSSAQELGLTSKDSFRQIGDYVSRVFGKKIARSKITLNIEDLFTNIEIEIERSPSSDFLVLRQHLLDLIRDVLFGLENKIIIENGEYHQFDAHLEPTDTIITFNWDLLLDNVLQRKAILEAYKSKKRVREKTETQYKTFVVKLTAFGEGTWGRLSIPVPYEVWDSEVGYYLKMHGSVDWFYCQNENCRGYNRVFPLLETYRSYNCSECDEPIDFLIIPPVLNKTYREFPLIRRIWNTASNEITNAEEIIIWGYSLPPTDFYSSWLLRQARGAQLKSLSLINPRVVNERTKKIAHGFVRDFFSIFRDTLSKESLILYESFGDYCNGLDVLEKYNLGSPKDAFRYI